MRLGHAGLGKLPPLAFHAAMILRAILMCAAAGALCSCASVTVTDLAPLSQPGPSHLPQKIYVQPFTFEGGEARVDREGEKLVEFQHAMQREMSQNLAERVRKSIAPAESLPESVSVPPGDHWVLSGRFVRMNQGSRFLRSAFGFGSGGTKVVTETTVATVTVDGPQPFLLIRTSGGSNAMPGAILGVINWTMILSGGQGLAAGLSGDCRRTSREITAGLAEYLREHNLPVAKDAPKPKMRHAAKR